MYNFTSFLKSLNSEQFYIRKKLNSKIKAVSKAIKSNIICKYLQRIMYIQIKNLQIFSMFFVIVMGEDETISHLNLDIFGDSP